MFLKYFKLIFDKFFCLFSRVYLFACYLVFRFNKWHIVGNMSCRPYKANIAKIINDLNPVSVVEIGCGLGEILLNVNAPIRKGYDIDFGAIRYLNFLNKSNACFSLGSFKDVDCNSISILVLINWMHDIDELFLKKEILRLLPYCDNIILDKIDDQAPDTYIYKHKFLFLEDCCIKKTVFRFGNEPREFVLYKFK